MYLDNDAEIDMSLGGNLPHWHQDQALQFVTFRLADSLPQSVLRPLKDSVDRFKASHPLPWDEDVKRQYWRLIDPAEERLLARGYGRCVLRDPAVRNILARIISNRHNIDYRVLAYVIMPNHVHILLEPIGDKRIDRIIQSIKRLSSISINRSLGQSGQLWQSESFDRIIRSSSHLYNCLSYIRNNPRFLPSSHYTLHIDDLWKG